MENQVVVFELASEHFGVAIQSVESIIKMQAITRVPNAPHFVEGVTNLRGHVIPVIDLRKRFNLPAQENTKNSRIVVVSMETEEVGIVVDAVSEVLTIPDDAVEPPPGMVTTIDSSFITSIAKVDSRLVILLDLMKVLTSDEKASLKTLPA